MLENQLRRKANNDLPKVEIGKVFDERMVKATAERRIPLEISAYSLDQQETVKSHSTHLSMHGIEFASSSDYARGTLLRINVFLPDFWRRKRKLVNYQRVEPPEHFRILAKVMKIDVHCRKSRKKLVLAQTVNMDEIDEKVLSSWLQETAAV